MLGTLLNVACVLVGGGLGLFAGSWIPERMSRTIRQAIGLFTIALGIQTSLQTASPLIVLGSLLGGGMLGELLRIEDGLQALEKSIDRLARRDDSGRRVSQAFMTASLIFCVGPLTVVGSILDGMTGDYQPLLVKSVLDGFTALALAASLGAGVLLSALTVLVVQGSISVTAMLFASTLGEVSAETPAVVEMSATGGLVILALGFVLLDLKEIRVGSLFPAIVLAPTVVILVERLAG